MERLGGILSAEDEAEEVCLKRIPAVRLQCCGILGKAQLWGQ